ncbi:MAG: hypothetical protein OXC80_09395 [Gammaproteobacteria bacterium]|nr:hypothetical protein [Gammaproteobacteria bacterium]
MKDRKSNQVKAKMLGNTDAENLAGFVEERASHGKVCLNRRGTSL